MQSVNDDMDELFKSAAENYPLNTNSADWDKVMQQLHPAGEAAPVAPKKKDNTKYLWLLLLLPFVFICNRYTGSDDVSLNNKNNVPQQEVATNKVVIQDKKQKSNITTTEQNRPVTLNRTKKNNQYITQESSVYPLYKTNPDNTNNNKHAKGIDNEPKDITEAKKNSRVNDTKDPNKNIANGINNKASDIYNDKDINHEKSDIAISVDNSPKVDNSAKEGNNISINDSIVHEEKVATINTDSSESERAKPVTVKSKNNKKGFYAGITFGPDYSTIKFQQIKKSGYSVGILAGYQLNNHWAVETGGLWDKKNYYSEGAYFNTKKITIPNNVKIIDVTGTCYMIEIPVNVKYTITNSAKGNWFVLAGTSSYLMKKEDYTYLYDHNSSVYDVYRAYKNATRNWFSIINISAGYERTLSNIATIRMEPYIKIPISGVGTGSLPITSAGIYISVTRPVFK